MDKQILEKFIAFDVDSLVSAMKKIDSNTLGLVYVVDKNNVLVGCLTDGDARRWIIRTGSIDGVVSDVMNHAPKSILLSQRNMSEQIMRQYKIYSLAVVNEDCHIEDIIIDPAILQSMTIEKRGSLSNTPVVIMAGGKGTRLYPYTKILPKPLIPIGEVPIIERILNRFSVYGIEDFWLSVNYKKEMIKSYFSELSPGYRLHYIEEDKPLGTAGSIRLLKEIPENPLIIANCDCLINANYYDMIGFHKSSQNAMTIVSALKNVVIPYGVLRSESEGVVSSVEEKPQLSYFINTGMYILDPEYISWIPEGEFFHMTQLVEALIQKGKKVGMYPISEDSFLDMGEFEEMKKMEEKINSTTV